MKGKASNTARGFWLRHLHQWHWVSAAICIVGMLLFAATGITLNHAGQIEARPKVTTTEARVAAALVAEMGALPEKGKTTVPESLSRALAAALPVDVRGREAELSQGEIYIGLPRPGGDAWLTVDRATGDVIHEITDRGWVSYLNDLHKGRNTGTAWSWFLDIFAGACLVFCISGLLLLHLHAGARPATWPLVGFGLAAPLVLTLLFIH